MEMDRGRICGLLCKWKKRWEYYGYKNMELFKKSVMTGIAFMGFSLSLAVMKIPFIPIRLNVVSWWMTVFVLGELTVYGQGKRLSILFLGIALLTGCIGFWLTAKREKEENKSARKGKLAMIYFTVCLFFFGMGMERMESFVSQCKLADSIAEDSVWFFAGMIDKIERKNDNFYLYVKHSQIYWEGEYVGEFSVCLQTGEEGWHTGDWIRGNAQNKQWNRARNEGNYNEKNQVLQEAFQK